MTKVSFPLLGSISAELNWPARPASTRWAGSNAPGKWSLAEYQRHAWICGGSVTPSADCTSWWEWQKSSQFTAISPNCP